MPSHELNAILQKLEKLETQLDEVRTKDLPAVKQDVALLIQRGSLSAKVFAAVVSVSAVFVSVLLSHVG